MGALSWGKVMGTLYNVWELCITCGSFNGEKVMETLHNVWELCVMCESVITGKK